MCGTSHEDASQRVQWLRSAEGVKTAVLQHDIAEVQKDITRIDEILMFMEEIAVGDPKDALIPPPVEDPA